MGAVIIAASALVLAFFCMLVSGDVPVILCRSYCGNITVDFPFSLRQGCGHSAFRELLFCIDNTLMLRLPSSSFRVLDIDYLFSSLTLHDPAMSDCYFLRRHTTTSAIAGGGGFSVEPWRSPYLRPAPDNAFLLLRCRSDSPLFQGFSSPRRLPCRNVSGISCEDYYSCPAWDLHPRGAGETPPPCCSLPYSAMGEINLTHLGCEGYASAYSLAPVRRRGPGEWSYGIRVDYSVPEDDLDFCRACQATGGLCGFDVGSGSVGGDKICLCEGWNSTTNCDSSAVINLSAAGNSRRRRTKSLLLQILLSSVLVGGFL